MTQEELTDLILENQGYLYRLAFSYLKNEADVQDAVGETIVKAFENVKKLRKKENAKAWLMQILANQSKSMLRKRKRLNIDIDSHEQLVPFQYDELWSVVMELPRDIRITIVLFYYEQFSVREISKILKIAEGTVKSRLARGRQKLFEILN